MCVRFWAALLVMGSAVSLLSCGGKGDGVVDRNKDEALVTRSIDSIRRVTTDNGRVTNVFITPLMEEHALATPSFSEYVRGIEVIGYNDSTGVENSRVVADYALHWAERDLWELKGNVMVSGDEGRQLFTQQLNWDMRTGKIYSNVDSRVQEGNDVFIGQGFEAEDDFSSWRFRRLTGTVSVDTTPSAAAEPVLPVDSLVQ